MKWILKIMLDACILATVWVAVMALAGVGGQVADVRDYGRGAVEARYCLGFSHANNLHGTLWYIFSLILILYKDRLNWICYLLMTVLNITLFVFTASKAGVAVAQLIIIAGLAYRYANRAFFEKKWLYIVGAVAFAGIIALTLVSVSANCWTYGPVLSKLDSITTGRFTLAYQSAYIGDWKLFSPGGTHKYPVDNGFAGMAADYGIIVWLAYIVFIFAMIWISAKKKNGVLFAVIMTCIMYTFMERSFVLNDAYLLSNLLCIAAMCFLGEKKPLVAKEV